MDTTQPFVNVLNPLGQPENVAPSELAQALKLGYKIAPPEQVADFKNEQQYGTGLMNPVKAAAAGALRGSTFGLSDELMTKTGMVNPETLEGLKHHQRAASFLGEAAAIPASLVLAPELSPVGMVSKLGQGVTKALAPEAGAAVSGILGQVGSHAVGSAVEGAAYGLGQSVSEHALGDTDATGEHLLSNVGYSALLAGGLGGLLGLGKGVAGARAASGAGPTESSAAASIKQDMAEQTGVSANPEKLDEVINELVPDPLKKKSYMDGLKELKKNADEIKQAGQEIGAPVLESQLSASQHVRDLDSTLIQSPTIVGIKRQQLLQEGLDAASGTIDRVLGPEVAQSEAEVGTAIKQTLSSKLQGEYDPLGQAYESIKSQTEHIPVKPQQTTVISNNIRELGGKFPSSPGYTLAHSVADDIKLITTVDDVKALKSSLEERMGQNFALKGLVGRIREKLTNLEENTIVYFAQNEANIPGWATEEREKALGLIGERKATNLKYAQLMDKMGEIGEVTGKKKIRGTGDFLNFIDNLTPEKLVSRLTAKKNSEFLSFFSEHFPEEMKMITDLEKSKLRIGATEDGKVLTGKVLSELDKYSPEFRKVLFTPEELKKLNAVQVWTEALPKNANPSGTSKAEAIRRMVEHPLSTVLFTARDALAMHGIKGLVDTGQTAEKVQGLIGMERAVKQTTNRINRGAKEIFNYSGTITGFVGSKLAPDDHEKMTNLVTELANNPDKLAANLDKATRDLYHIAPQSSQALAIATAKATSLLASKVPTGPQKPLSPKYIPSNTEVAKFSRYVHALNDPVGVLEQVKTATLTPEALETLQVVYPKMYNQMKLEVMDQLSSSVAKKKKVPYGTMMALSQFLDQDLDNSLDQQSIASNQLAQATIMGQEQAKNEPALKTPSTGGMAKLGKAQNLLTSQQAATQRKA